MIASIIIPVLDQVDYFEKLIFSIKRYAKDCELIVIDNGSKKHTKEYIDEVKPDTLIRHKENMGVAKAWNEGAVVASTDKLIFLNSDMVFGEGFIEHMTGALETCHHVQPKFENKEIKPDFFQRAAELAKEDRPAETATSLCGFAFGMTKKLYKKIGPFDEDFLVYVDKDYAYRLEKKGIPRYELPSILVHHYESRTLAEMQAAGFDWYAHDTKMWNKKWE